MLDEAWSLHKFVYTIRRHRIYQTEVAYNTDRGNAIVIPAYTSDAPIIETIPPSLLFTLSDIQGSSSQTSQAVLS